DSGEPGLERQLGKIVVGMNDVGRRDPVMVLVQVVDAAERADAGAEWQEVAGRGDRRLENLLARLDRSGRVGIERPGADRAELERSEGGSQTNDRQQDRDASKPVRRR